MKYSVIDNKGLMLLTGDVGTGKTTLINTLLESLGNDVYYASVPDPRLDLIDFLNYIAQAFHIDGEFKSKGEFLLHFGWFLEGVYKQKKKVLLIIDESQLLTQDLLEEIRLLSNINREGNHLLNIFFVGQNEFNEILHRPENRAVTQRITLNYQISPLSAEETELYILHRLSVAGASRPLFSSAAIREISLHSEGIPRRINVICDHCLLTGYIEEKSVIDSKIVRECIKDIAIPQYSEAARSGSKRYEKRRQGKKSKSSRPAWQNLVFLMLSAVLLSLLAAVLATPSFNVSGKLVSFYQGVVMSLRGNSAPDREAGQQEGAGKRAISAETGRTDSGEVKEPAESEAHGPAGTQDKDTGTPEEPAGENLVDGAGGIETGSTARPGRQAGLTSIEIDARIYEQETAVETAEKEEAGENVETAAAADLGELPEAVSMPVPEKTALGQDYRFSGESETRPKDVASEPEEQKVIIRFTRNSNDFSTSNLDQLIRLGLSVRDRDAVSLKISGYTDSSGSAGYNDRLSLVRATMVKSYLLGLGIHPDRLEVQGLGSQNPIADNATEEGKQLNRRVEVEMIERTR